MKTFNSFQIVVAFCAWPFLITWLSEAGFKGASVAFYAACAAYIVAFICMIASVRFSLDKWDF